MLGIAAPGAAVAQAREAEMIEVRSWLGSDNYPPEAFSAREEGRVVVIVSIDRDGRIERCSVDTSAGHDTLDKGTCDLMLTKGKFAPARDARGEAIASTKRITVAWALPGDAPAGRPGVASGVRTRTLDATIGRDGTVLQCTRDKDGNGEFVGNDICAARTEELALAARIVPPNPRLLVRIMEASRKAATASSIPPPEKGMTIVAGVDYRYVASDDGTIGACSEAMKTGVVDRLPVALRTPPCQASSTIRPPAGWTGEIAATYRLSAEAITPLAIGSSRSEVIMTVSADDEVLSCEGDRDPSGMPLTEYCAWHTQMISALRSRFGLRGRIMVRFVEQQRIADTAIPPPTVPPGEKVSWRWVQEYRIGADGEGSECRQTIEDNNYGDGKPVASPCLLLPVYDRSTYPGPAARKLFVLNSNTSSYRVLSDTK